MVTDHPVVRVEDVHKVFRAWGITHRGAADVHAVKGVGFELREGDSLAIVGESGSGKTTTARMLAGLERPTAGTVWVAGRQRGIARRISLAERRRNARELQMVLQDPYTSLDRHQSIVSAIDEVLALHFSLGRAARARRIAELLEQVGLDRREGAARPHQLSGGQRQRAAIARALALEPRVLVLDEPVAALDVSIQAQVLNLLADIREATAITYVFISHDLAVVRHVTDQILVMKSGTVVERGRTAEVLNAPRDPYTQLLIDAVPGPNWHTANGAAKPRSQKAVLTGATLARHFTSTVDRLAPMECPAARKDNAGD